MARTDNLIRPALLFALGIHCLLLSLSWIFHDASPVLLEVPTEISVEFETAQSPEEIEEIVEEPEPVVEEVEEIVGEPEPVVEEVEEIVGEPEPVVEEVEEIVEEPEPVVEEVEEIVGEPEPVVEEVEEIVEEPEPVVEEVEEIVEEPEPVVEEVEKVAADSEPVVEELEKAYGDSEPIPEKSEEIAKIEERKLSNSSAGEKNLAESTATSNAQEITTEKTADSIDNKSTGREKNGISKSQIPESYFQIVLSKIAAAQRYPQYARDQGFEGEVLVEFIIKGDGELGKIKVINPTGHPSLDQESMAIVKRAAPFPPLAEDEENNLLTMRITIVFKLESD
ncbi:MAG: energy transducer TonB [Firmicutes bacterium]|nr:energy transducer TonB [Bacillota bacterium]